MNVEELMKAGELGQAIEAQNQVVKSHPLDQDARFLLFSLLCFAGDLDRATRQLEVFTGQDPKLEMGVRVYRSLLDAETERRRVHQGEGSPLLPPEPVPHLTHRLDALGALAGGNGEQAEAALEAAGREAPTLGGTIDGAPFDGLRDQDDLLGSCLEVFAGGRYVWMPFERIRKLRIPEPSTLLDLLWIQVELEDVDKGTYTVHLPVLYHGSHEASDDAIRLGRLTEWADQEEIAYRGSGQRVLLVHQEDSEVIRGLLSVREIEFTA